ncbi:COG1714 Predicted membrane protein/domain [Burkholderiaceae bacterium]
MKTRTSPSTALTQTPAPPRLRRFASMMYEGVLLFAVVFLAGYLFDTLTQSRHALMLRDSRQVWLFIAIGAYFLICWRRSGQTLPMKAWHIKVLAANGQPAPTWRLLVRYACMWVLPLLGAGIVWAAASLSGWNAMLMLIVATPFLVFIPTWFTAEQQFLHDLLAGTRLVNVQPQIRTSKNP